MKIISIYTGHNSNAAYFEDGVCRFIFHEEKFNNIKNFTGFPVRAFQFLASKIDMKKVDHIAFSDVYFQFVADDLGENHIIEKISRTKLINLYRYLGYVTRLKAFDKFLKWVSITFVCPRNWRLIEKWMAENYGIEKEIIWKVDHHLAHALSPVYFYGLVDTHRDFLLMTLDGGGDLSCSKVFVFRAKDKSVSKIADSRDWASLGFLYNGITRFLGMKANDHAHKVMGLAAYVSDRKYYQNMYDQLKDVVWLDEKRLEFGSKFYTDSSDYYFKKHFVGQRFDNVAAAAQRLLEDVVTRWIRAAVKKTGIRNIAVSGGVFMNVKMNQKITAMEEVEKVYFQPSCGDESNVIGVAADVFIKNKIDMRQVGTMYLGHRYTDQEVEAYLRKNGYFGKYDITHFEDIETEVARMLSEHKVVARFKGASEWGARSLGNRAILANASDYGIFYEVNDMVKMRDFWMPFAPVILGGWAERYIKDWSNLKNKIQESSKYMILAFDSTRLAQKHLRAAIHQKDKTLRPQVLEEKDNSDLFRLLKEYEKLTGMGGLLNTSLNLHGYPLASTLEQGMFTFENSGLKYMAIENWLVIKNRK